MGRAATFVVLLIILAMSASDGRAQGADIAQDAQRIFSQVMSPYCPGKVLADCTSSSAAELRAEIRNRLEAGESADAILNDLYARFGEEIRPAPPADSGWGRFLRIVPLIVFLISLVAIVRYLSRKRPSPQPQRSPVTDQDLERRLQDELDNY
jgi:cytochrome c-type biogenesis protein CcmH